MINSKEFTERLQKVIDFYDESASSFAENIGVQRSSISHILSGRNKPSLDFVMKVLHSYPDVELYWLLNGKGNFPSAEEKLHSNNLENQLENQLKEDVTLENVADINESIEKIVIFYRDGTFKSYNP